MVPSLTKMVATEMERNALDQEKSRVGLMGLGHGLDVRERKSKMIFSVWFRCFAGWRCCSLGDDEVVAESGL